MFRNGWDNNIKDADAIPALQSGSKARTAEANGEEMSDDLLALMYQSWAHFPEQSPTDFAERRRVTPVHASRLCQVAFVHDSLRLP
jgi:hypothetical protein